MFVKIWLWYSDVMVLEWKMIGFEMVCMYYVMLMRMF